MQNKGRYFTFHFSQTSRSRIYIRRVQVSKKLVQNGLLSIALIIGFTTFGSGIYGVFSYADPSAVSLAASIPATPQLSSAVSKDPISYDYSRPAASSNLARNSGGPSLTENGVEDAEVENQLRLIETTSGPLALPNMWAIMGKINNEFGFRRNPFGGRTYEFHGGIDIDGQRGDVVVAPAAGTVSKAGWQGGYGNLIEIDHGNGLTTLYGHLSKIEVAVGDSISRGQLMGYVGSTGRSTGPHLHYELRLNDRPINPRRFLPPEPTEIARQLQ
ncbi:hypothetical protein BH24ACI3_BH24ACI3_12950 [soil metagenome]